jgi:hypothetical protein
MISICIFAIPAADKAFVAVILGSLVALAAVTRRLHSLRAANAEKDAIAYRERFQQMKAEVEAKYGPSVELLRPEMELDDDPELFHEAWKEFLQDHGGHVTTSR